MDRNSLLGGDATPMQEREDVFGDEYEEDFDFVADGFRPNVEREDSAAGVHDAEAHQEMEEDVDAIEPVRPLSTHYHHASSPTRSPLLSRNSLRKSRGDANPFASSEDDDATPREGEPSLEFEPDNAVRRSQSTTSGIYAQTNSPRFGAGPSHPYGMYQQGTLGRSASMATTSTMRPTPQRQSFAQTGPQHPYSMYPQGVDEDLDDEEEPLHHNPVLVGFPGIGQSYTRRIGPDGEDQDIIGADGHTEQLPPYTRYPEEGPEKMPLLPTALHSRAPVHGTDPGMDLMHTALRITPSPPPAPAQSMSDESTLVGRRGSGSHLALISSNGSESGNSWAKKEWEHKSWKEKTWKERRKTRYCGIPVWCYMLGLGVLVFIGAVLGGIIGGFVAGGNHARQQNSLTVLTTLVDASPITTTPTVSPPTGTFALSLGLPQETQCDCLATPNQRSAWDCNLAPNAALGLVVGPQPGGAAGARVFYASYDTQIAYGSQLNQMNTSMASFLMVLDVDDPNNGAAFYFQQYYDKVVVVPEDALSISNKKGRSNKRQASYSSGFQVPSEWQQQQHLAVPGDKPWFCVWNQTFLEGFIYINKHTSSSTTSSAAPTTAANSTPATTSTSSAIVASSPQPTPTATTTTPSSADYLTTTYSGPLTTAAFTGPSSQYPGWSVGIVADAKRREYEQFQAQVQEDEQDDHHAKRQASTTAVPNVDFWETLQNFPYVLKLEERRTPISGNIQPYCQQYQVLDNGHANVVLDSNGNTINVELNEDDPNWSAYQSADAAISTASPSSKRMLPNGCHCQWMSGE